MKKIVPAIASKMLLVEAAAPGHDSNMCLRSGVVDPNCCAPDTLASCSGGYVYHKGIPCTDGFVTYCSPYIAPYNHVAA